VRPSYECGLSACCCDLAGVGGGVKRRLARKKRARKESGEVACARHEGAHTSRATGRYARLGVVDDEIRAHYETGIERDRLTKGYSRLEFVRTKELLERHLPPRPARVLDVGGGPGVYADWLASRGYEVRLVDPVPLHVEQAAEVAGGRFTVATGDARQLDEKDESYDAVLLLGPLYHLTERRDRLCALAEARRVLRPGGVVAAAAISRFASLLDGAYAGYLDDPKFSAIVERDLADGQHRSPGCIEYFTTSYFHRPEELHAELQEAGLEVAGFFGVEGPGWLLVRDDADVAEVLLRVARALEQEPSTIGTSAHLLAIARRP
jgi:SAM-dependent methyltransferase